MGAFRKCVITIPIRGECISDDRKGKKDFFRR
jgi:hypothetical protein